ncbi:MAG: hypothetical protein WBY93_24000, partial [Candidatus Binatus sp.]
MTPADRNNEPLDAILRRAMRDRPGPATPECADAESLAAYSDKSIAAAERERLESHFADCMRCQVLLADIARAEESARIAESASEMPWYRRWRIAIPALAAVAAVVVFISIRRPANDESERDQLATMAKNEVAPATMNFAEQKPPPAPAAPAVAPAPAPAVVAAAPASDEIAMNEAARTEAPRAHAMGAAAPGAIAGNAAVSTMDLAAQKPPPAPAAQTVAPAAPAAPVTEFAMNSTREAPRALAGSAGALASATAMVAQGGAAKFETQSYGAFASGAAVSAATSRVPGQSKSAAEGSLATIEAPGGSVAWIVGRNGMVQRRDANGAIQIQQSGVTTDLTAGAAPSATVCWIVGRSGTVIRTTDGEHWTLVIAPTMENLTAVSAADANDATITTAGGRSFATSDGGA